MTLRRDSLLAVVLLIGLFSVTSAHAQTADAPRIGAGLSTTKSGGIGVNGGVLYPIKDYGTIRSLGVVGAASILKFDGYHVLSFGGGLRWTRKLETTSDRDLRIYAQGLFGAAHDSGGGYSATDKGFTGGGGVGFKVNPSFDAFVEVDAARLLPSEFNGYNALVFTFGLSKPFGKQ